MRRLRPREPRSGAAIPWHEEGEEPDYRFSLANERTFLAWIRTGLVLLAGAVAVAQFVQPLAHSEAGLLTALAWGASLAGIAVLLLVWRVR
ncbi:putative integral membrane protein [Streptomyces himastatinicus ATCC 53653]|uniref:Putative integral membrane protein n=1 Tax=Streptomyces himastatinicus ATCC 53653 TaxID=457427 RepID=D9WKP2_9ACTN|nr:putative integral membrane protein [Streptomyces himastatinicus ATCC 53653]